MSLVQLDRVLEIEAGQDREDVSLQDRDQEFEQDQRDVEQQHRRQPLMIAEPGRLQQHRKHGVADAVLVDAPCSGTGTWRRNPEARWRLSEAQLARHAKLQARLLDLAAIDADFAQAVTEAKAAGLAVPKGYAANPPVRKRNAWSYIDARDLGEIVRLCLEKDGLGFQVFNATNDTITLNIPTKEALKQVAPRTPVTREMGEFEAPLSNRKIREVLGFKEAHNWRTHVSG